MSYRRLFRPILLVFLVLILSTTAYVFAASNTVPAGRAGDGANTIGDYTITNVQYNLNASSPANIDSATFTMSPSLPADGTVTIQLVTTGSWYSCTVAGGTNVTCTTTGASASTANNLRIVISE